MKIITAAAFLCLLQERPKDQTPITSATPIMLSSTHSSARKPSPQSGNVDNANGTTAQWMAQKVEAVIPIRSSLFVSVSVPMSQMYK